MSNICLILEGAYPFTGCGLSNWVHQLVTGLPEFEFTIAHIYAGHDGTAHADLPNNVIEVIPVPLYDADGKISLQRLMAAIPPANLYHALGTGFAGWVAAEMKACRDTPFLLTEHGVYWHEIEMGIAEMADGSPCLPRHGELLSATISREKWQKTFHQFARTAYKAADAITAVSEYSRQLQVSAGAAASKTQLIYDGVDTRRFSPQLREPDNTGVRHIGLVGGVTANKDIKTFIKAGCAIQLQLPNTHFYVIGPVDEDQAYYGECTFLVEELGLRNFTFTGDCDPREYYSLLDVLVLTSISEALPLALLEGMACGLPVVSTDVGACRELVYGEEDDYGTAGFVAPPKDAYAVAVSIVALCREAELSKRCSQAGPQRIKSYYRSDQMMNGYRRLYRRWLRIQAIKGESRNVSPPSLHNRYHHHN